MKYKTLSFKDDKLRLLDQRVLPGKITYFEADDYLDVKVAISDMVVRGAPAIGAAAAYGVYLAACEYKNLPETEFIKKIRAADEELASARPTAVNLTWAINKMETVLQENHDREKSKILSLLRAEADKIAQEDIAVNKAIGNNGNQIVPENAVILTHCNAGALATVDYGTALGVIRAAHEDGKNISVYADETRPRLQGARLTSFELKEEGIPVTLIVDSAAATLIRDAKIDVVITGADRIAANGDTANKIGTYMLSELAFKFDVPFYIAAPLSTIDFSINSGNDIEIEERSPKEVTEIEGKQIAPDNIDVYNPAFDVTPAANISGIITEKKIVTPPFKDGLKEIQCN